MEPQDRTVVQLLAALQVDVPFGVETGRLSQLTVPLEGARLNPWHPINGHQMQCDACARKRLAEQASESPRPGAR